MTNRFPPRPAAAAAGSAQAAAHVARAQTGKGPHHEQDPVGHPSGPAGYEPPTCVCTHVAGDHGHWYSWGSRTPLYGVCLVPGCKCDAFVDRDVRPPRKAA